MSKKKVIGFIGLGNMGYYMATHLINAGYEMVLYDINDEVLNQFSGPYIETANSPADVANKADILLVSLPTPKVVEEVATGENGIVEGSQVKVYIDLSTTGQEVSEKVGDILISKGIEVLDSPVSGGVPGAKDGALSIMIAGKHYLFEECYELLKHLAKKVLHVGDKIGQAQVMKVINNLLSSAALAITSEAVVLGVKAGLDPDKMIDIFNVSTGRNSATETKFKQSIINRKFNYGFSTDLVYKDIKLCMELAEYIEMPMFLGQHIAHFWRYVLNRSEKGSDSTAIIKFFEEWAGVEVGKKVTEVK
ncbi:NAD(P)-dependent oxidoreductase [Oceanobacillus halophilus]|uniref:NAD(P)-dependent oxidoreductase n=1 Tax=Oceanobacillus halophilus TaxID=930130 RepID=A0A495A7L4_9BACI|nr:NAD(P)-dependent oxidoreductase [Oceanobacillus halophilus]RKQ35782.1 NAD(P)-dependent oxidoreductase [Oceanobacillus halophilus]